MAIWEAGTACGARPSGRKPLAPTAFTASFGSLFAVIGKVAAAILATFATCFRSLLTIVGEVARIITLTISHDCSPDSFKEMQADVLPNF
jgi:hypothetical protein